MRTIRYLLFLPVLTGCWFGDSTPSATSDEAVSVEAYLSRASLKATEFEQYKLLPLGLFAECGSVAQGRQTTKEQGIHVLERDARENISQVASELFKRVQEHGTASLDRPGDNSDLFDPGKALITIRVGSSKIDVNTSLDSVEQNAGETTNMTKKLLTLLRGSVDRPMCGNNEFYGIGR